MIVAISRASSSFGMRGLSVREPRALVAERAAPPAAFVSLLFCALDSAVARLVFFILGTMYLGRGGLWPGNYMPTRHLSRRRWPNINEFLEKVKALGAPRMSALRKIIGHPRASNVRIPDVRHDLPAPPPSSRERPR